VKIVSVMEILYVPTTETVVLPDIYYKELERVAKEQAEAAVKYAAERIRSGKASGGGGSCSARFRTPSPCMPIAPSRSCGKNHAWKNKRRRYDRTNENPHRL
jgi:hypothetical protein